MSRFNFIGRKRDSRFVPPDEPGYVDFDDRGNAIYQWREVKGHEQSDPDDRQQTAAALLNPTLSLVDDHPEYEFTPINAKGLRMGYNPYESGCLVRTRKEKDKKPKDLRALSKWIEQTRKLDRKLDMRPWLVPDEE